MQHFDSRQHAHDLFLGHLHHPAEGMMRRSVHEGGPHGSLPSEQSGALGPRNRIAAAVGDQIGASHSDTDWALWKLGGSVDNDGNACLTSAATICSSRIGPRASPVPRTATMAVRCPSAAWNCLQGLDLDHARTPSVRKAWSYDVAGLPGDDHFVLQPGQIGQLLDQFRIVPARHAAVAWTQRRRGTRRHDGALTADELGDPGADLLHQLVEIDRMAAAWPEASRTSGSVRAPPLIVSVPVRLMNGRTPIRV